MDNAGKDKVVRFVFDTEKGMAQILNLTKQIDGIDDSVRNANYSFETMVRKLQESGVSFKVVTNDMKNEARDVQNAIDVTFQKPKEIINEKKELSTIDRMKKAIDDFNKGVTESDKRMNGFFNSVYKIMRMFYRLTLWAGAIKGIFMGGDLIKSFISNFKRIDEDTGKTVLTIPNKLNEATKVAFKDFAGKVQFMFKDALARSTFEGFHQRIVKNMLEMKKTGMFSMKGLFEGSAEELRKGVEKNHPIVEGLYGFAEKKFKNTNWKGMFDFSGNVDRSRKSFFKFGQEHQAQWEKASKFRKMMFSLLGQNPYMMLGKGIVGVGKGVWGVHKNVKGLNNTFGDAYRFGLKFLKLPLIAGAAFMAFKAGAYAVEKMMDAGLKAEETIKRLTVSTGSVKEAKKRFEEAKMLAIQTGFKEEEVQKAGALAGSFGYKNPYERTKELGGTSVTELAMGMSAASGQSVEVSMRALMKADAAVLDYFPAARDKYNKMIGEGLKPNTKDFQKQFAEEVSKIPEYMSAIAVQANSVGGLLEANASITAAWWDAMAGVTAEEGSQFSFWQSLKRILTSMKESGMAMLEPLMPVLQFLGSTIGVVLEALYEVGKLLFNLLLPVIIWIGAKLMFWVGVIWVVAQVIKYIAMFLNWIIKWIVIGAIELAKLVGRLLMSVEWIATLIDYFKLGWIFLQVLWQLFMIWIDDPLRALSDIWEILKKVGNFIGEILNVALEKAVGWISQAYDWLLAILGLDTKEKESFSITTGQRDKKGNLIWNKTGDTAIEEQNRKNAEAIADALFNKGIPIVNKNENVTSSTKNTTVNYLMYQQQSQAQSPVNIGNPIFGIRPQLILNTR